MTTTETLYDSMSITAPAAGFVKVDASFTAINNAAGGGLSCGMNARLRRVTGTVINSLAQEEAATNPSDGNLALTHVFPVAAGVNVFELLVWEDGGCDLIADTGQISGIYATSLG